MSFHALVMRLRRLRSIAVASAALLAVSGCGGETKLVVHPVSGQVLHRGQPLANALIVFHDKRPREELQQIENLPIPRATTDAEGKFQLSSYGGPDGAPAGEYNVTVFMQGAMPEEGEDPESVAQEPDRLGARYADPETSGLSATIKPGDNQLPPFELN